MLKKPLKFYDMGDKPLAYPVKCGKTVVIPAGTTGVKIAFHRSHLLRWDEERQTSVPMNIYYYKGKIYHA